MKQLPPARLRATTTLLKSVDRARHERHHSLFGSRRCSAIARATALIEGLTQATPGYKRLLRIFNLELVTIVESVLATEAFSIQCERQVFEAMVELKAGRGSFGDALISALGREAGCSATYTFDRMASRLPGFTAL